MSQRDGRCPRCGALVARDAEWCGQCFAPLGAREEPETPRVSGEPQPSTQPTAGAPPEGHEPPATARAAPAQGEPAWPCPVCGNRNAIELNVCAVCGTPFGKLFEEPARARPHVTAEQAAVWSLLFPGLGHWKLGRGADGLARAILFVWTLGTLLVLVVSRFGKGGLGPTTALVLLFLAASLVLYVTSAYDAYRLASGETPLVSSRTLLWGSAGLVVLSVLIATLVAIPAARGR